jgi:tetratricopeptide (TPR) repeat protein
MPVTTALWHFARGMALADKGDIPAATAERAELAEGIAKFTPETMYAMLNPAANVLGVGQLMLDAKIAAVQKQYREAERLLRQAVELDDKLNYMEPPDWLLPPRETLGGILLLQSNPAEAEKVFREDLNRNPRSARSLFGLWQSLEAQGKPYDADLVHRQFDAVWKNADIKLKVSDL